MLDGTSVTYVSSTGMHQEKKSKILPGANCESDPCRTFDCILDLLHTGEMEVSMDFRSGLYFWVRMSFMRGRMKADMSVKFLSNHASICAAVYVNIAELHITSCADDFTHHFHPTHPMHTFPEPWEAWPVTNGSDGDHIMKFSPNSRMDSEVWKNMQEPMDMNIDINGGRYLTRQNSNYPVCQPGEIFQRTAPDNTTPGIRGKTALQMGCLILRDWEPYRRLSTRLPLYKSKLTQYLTVKLNFTEVFARGHISSHPQSNRLQNSDSPILAWHFWQALTPVGFGFGFFFSVRPPAAPPHTFSNFSDHLPPPHHSSRVPVRIPLLFVPIVFCS
jgi:hypothetical protein